MAASPVMAEHPVPESSRNRSSTISKLGRFFSGASGDHNTGIMAASIKISTNSNGNESRSASNNSMNSSNSSNSTRSTTSINNGKDSKIKDMSELKYKNNGSTASFPSRRNSKRSANHSRDDITASHKIFSKQLRHDNNYDNNKNTSTINITNDNNINLNQPKNKLKIVNSNDSITPSLTTNNQQSNTTAVTNAISHPTINNSTNNQQMDNIATSSLGPGSTAGSAPVSRTSSIRASKSNINPRFKILPDGNHEHYLRSKKRQEKLGQMVKDWLGGSKKRADAVSALPNIFSSGNLNEMDLQIKSSLNNDNTALTENTYTISNSSIQSDINNQIKLPPTLFSMYVREHNKNANNNSISRSRNTEKENFKESFHEKYGKCQEIVGRGTFGVVRVSHKKVKNKEILYAVKEFTRKLNEPDEKYSKRLTYEFCISSSLKHDGIIQAYDLFKDSKGDYCEVMEYCQGGDLYSLIASAGKLEYSEADCFFKQIMRAVHYMHKMGVSHRDLKPENILLTQDGRVKITDFGSAECFKTAWDDNIELSNGIKGSSPYIAPEEFTDREFDPRFVDVWSCGVIYMAMRTGRQLWKEAIIDDEFFQHYLKKRKCEKGYEPIEQLKRARCRNVIYSILDPIPERRITTLQILNSEWVREIKCCKN